jgi:hypothetical protein
MSIGKPVSPRREVEREVERVALTWAATADFVKSVSDSPSRGQERQWLRRMLLTQPGLTNQQIVLSLPIRTWHSAPAGSVLARACAAAPSPASPDTRAVATQPPHCNLQTG